MTTSPDLPIAIDRREALRRTALLLGGLVSASAMTGVLAGCEASPAPRGAWTPVALTTAQGALVQSIAEQIIPATSTPGASAAGVHRFIDRMLAEYYTAEARTAFVAGLDDVDRRAVAATGQPFLRASAAEQHAILVELDRAAYEPAARAPFFRTMKELTLLGYYTSEIGASRELRFDRVPGRFNGCVPFATLGRASAT